MKYYIYVFAILCLSFSCNLPDKKGTSYSLRPSQVILSFPIDSTTANISTGLLSFEDYLININWKTNSLQFYNLQTQNLEKETFFPYEGPNGVGSLFGIHVLDLENIFLFPQIDNTITLADSYGKIKGRTEYQAPEGHTSAFVHNAYFGSAPLLSGSKFLVKTHVVGNYRAMTEERLSRSRLAYSIDLADSSVETLNFNYPADYLTKGLKFFEPSIVFHEDFIVYSLHGDHRLFRQTIDGDLETFEGKSEFLDEGLPLFPVEGERLETQKYLMASSRYESLIYDTYREVYYRFAYPTLPIASEDDLRGLRENPGPFVIQVFDSELNLLTERLFEGKIYFPNNSFITKDGLYLSINNPENPAANEDLFQFERIDLVEVN